MLGNCDRLLKLGDGLIVQVPLLQRLAQLIVANGKIGIQLQCFPGLLLGFVKPMSDRQCVRHVGADDQGERIKAFCFLSSAMASLFRPIMSRCQEYH